MRVASLMVSGRAAKVGGQAVIEGVMMRGTDAVSVAVRRKNKEILCHNTSYVSLTQRSTVLGWPGIRGFVQLVESLVLGLGALKFSADVAAQDESGPADPRPRKKIAGAIASVLTVVAACGLALLLFMYLPLLISTWIQRDQEPLLFNAIAGGIRIVIFVAYLWFISLWKDVRRVFEYHGAEHKAIFLYEAGKELTLENARQYTTHHPRCGTSFLLIVAFVCIAIFAVIDGLVAMAFGPYPGVAARFLVHVSLIPVVSGIGYEILKASERSEHWVVAALRRPGLWLQRITTREPDASQLEVAFAALEAVTRNPQTQAVEPRGARKRDGGPSGSVS
jgi:uncharacterized protein YqhQ